MHCVFCKTSKTKVVDSRLQTIEGEPSVRRRRVCESCGERFTTREVKVERDLMVIKSDGSTEKWDIWKLAKDIESCNTNHRTGRHHEAPHDLALKVMNDVICIHEHSVTTKYIEWQTLRLLSGAERIVYIYKFMDYGEHAIMDIVLQAMRDDDQKQDNPLPTDSGSA